MVLNILNGRLKLIRPFLNVQVIISQLMKVVAMELNDDTFITLDYVLFLSSLDIYLINNINSGI